MQCKSVLLLLLLGLFSAEARLSSPPKSAEQLMKKAKLETELAKKEIELSKEYKSKAEAEQKSSPEASKKDAAAAQTAMAAGSKAVKIAKEEIAEAKKAAPAATKEEKKAPVKEAAAKKKPAGPVDPAQQLAQITKGLETLSSLKSVFAANQGEKLDGQEIAEGAMTSELGKKDSAVWSTIMEMVAATQGAAKKLQSAKTKDEKEAAMKSVEDSLNAKAMQLGNFTKKVEETDKRHSEEYLLGLLNQHMGKWNATQEIAAVKKFQDLPIAKELLAHHDSSKPLAPQLGDLMDAEEKEQKAAKKAAKMFLQLAQSVKTASA